MKTKKALLLFTAAVSFLLTSCQSRSTSSHDSFSVEEPALFPVRAENRKWGYIDQNGQMVVKPQFESASEFHEGLARVSTEKGDGFIDGRGKVVLPPRYLGATQFQNGLVYVESGIQGPQHEGYINKAGKFVDERELALYYPEHLAPSDAKINGRVSTKSKCGYIDTTGRFLIAPQFTSCGEFSEGLAWVTVTKALPVHKVPPPPPDQIAPKIIRPYYNPPTSASSDALIDKHGKFVLEPFSVNSTVGVERCVGNEKVSENRRCFRILRKTGYLDEQGKIVIQPRFEDAGPFREGLAAAKIGSIYGYTDKFGNMVIAPQFESAGNFSEGLAPAGELRKVGYIGHGGTFIIAPKFLFAYPFSHGVARVDFSINGSKLTRRAYINTRGDYIWPPEKSDPEGIP